MTETDETSQLPERVFRAGVWAFALQALFRVLVVGRTIILGRLLQPADFGIVGIALIVLFFLDRLTTTGFQQALIQRRGEVERYFDTAWVTEIVRNLLTGAGLVLGAGYIALFFEAPEAESVVRAFGLIVAVRGFTNIGVLAFDRALAFKRRFWWEGSERAADAIVSIVLSFALRNVWALVFGYAAGSVVRVIASYLLHPYRPKLRFNSRQFRELYRYGRWILLLGVTLYFVNEFDNVVVGRLLGVTALGLYRMAFNLSQAVATELTHVISQVAMPTYASIQHEQDRLRRAYSETFHLIAFVGLPAVAGLVAIGPQFIEVVLGEKWLPMVAAMQILAVGGLARSLGATTGPLFQGTNKPELQFRFAVLQALILGAAIFPLTSGIGIEGAAAASASAAVVSSMLSLRRGARELGSTIGRLLSTALYPLGLSVAMGAMVWILADRLEVGLGPLLLSIAIGIGIYGIGVLAAIRWLGYRSGQQLLDRLRGLVGRRRRPPSAGLESAE